MQKPSFTLSGGGDALSSKKSSGGAEFVDIESCEASFARWSLFCAECCYSATQVWWNFEAIRGRQLDRKCFGLMNKDESGSFGLLRRYSSGYGMSYGLVSCNCEVVAPASEIGSLGRL